jgi:hypothetical protein
MTLAVFSWVIYSNARKHDKNISLRAPFVFNRPGMAISTTQSSKVEFAD